MLFMSDQLIRLVGLTNQVGPGLQYECECWSAGWLNNKIAKFKPVVRPILSTRKTHVYCSIFLP